MFDPDLAGRSWIFCVELIAGTAAQREYRRIGYPANAQRPLVAATRPAKPTAVLLYDSLQKLGCLALDFDAKGDREQARVDAFDAVRLLTEAGFGPVMDTNPLGGWHVYARLHQPQSHHSIRQLCAAFEARWPSFDKLPLVTDPLHACIRPPGSPHKYGGYQTLTMTPEAAQQRLKADPGPAAWNRLRHLVNAASYAAAPSLSGAGQWDLSKARGVHTKSSISLHAEHLAIHGHCPRSHNCRHQPYKSPSEVRLAILRSAVNNGWDFAAVQSQLSQWHWLRNSQTGKAADILQRDWHKAKQLRALEHATKPLTGRKKPSKRRIEISPYTQHKPAQLSNTRGVGQLSVGLDLDPYLHIRKFLAYAETEFRRQKLSPTDRAAVRAVTLMCHLQERLASDAGLRSYAEAANLDHTTVSRALRSDRMRTLVRRTKHGLKGTEADVWAIQAHRGADHHPASGKLWSVHPVFRVLGDHLEADVYQYLQAHKYECHSPTSIAATLGYDRRRVSEALYLLAGWQLACQAGRSWRLGTASPDQLAQQLGGFDHHATQHAKHRQHRAAWAQRLDRQPTIANQITWQEVCDAVEPNEDEWIVEFASGTAPPVATDHRAAG